MRKKAPPKLCRCERGLISGSNLCNACRRAVYAQRCEHENKNDSSDSPVTADGAGLGQMSMSAEPRYIADEEQQLEDAISRACAELALATDPDVQRLIFMRVQVLHGRRTKEQVERLERARGLIG